MLSQGSINIKGILIKQTTLSGSAKFSWKPDQIRDDPGRFSKLRNRFRVRNRASAASSLGLDSKSRKVVSTFLVAKTRRRSDGSSSTPTDGFSSDPTDQFLIRQGSGSEWTDLGSSLGRWSSCPKDPSQLVLWLSRFLFLYFDTGIRVSSVLKYLVFRSILYLVVSKSAKMK